MMKFFRNSLLLAFAVFATSATAQKMRVHFINVGQGSAVLVEFPCHVMLVDTGGEQVYATKNSNAFNSNVKLMSYLDQFFDERKDLNDQLDLLVITHPHQDHTRGIPLVLKKYKPRNVIHNNQSSGSGKKEQAILKEYVRDTEDVRGWYVMEGHIDAKRGMANSIIDPFDECEGIDPKITALWGQVKNKDGWHSNEFGDENNHSLLVRVDFGLASLLFTGDIEETEKGWEAAIEHILEKYDGTDLLDVDVLHVSHHGSQTGSTDAFIKAISPEISVMTTGPPCWRPEYSAFSHANPRKNTIEDLLKYTTGKREIATVKYFDGSESEPMEMDITAAIYATGWDGNIVLETDQDGKWELDSLSGYEGCK